ncbi:hypothetical protein [Chitinophaga eiseniae]|nr:hypothetical protein [Chitinophaga eiseniae]
MPQISDASGQRTCGILRCLWKMLAGIFVESAVYRVIMEAMPAG